MTASSASPNRRTNTRSGRLFNAVAATVTGRAQGQRRSWPSGWPDCSCSQRARSRPVAGLEWAREARRKPELVREETHSDHLRLGRSVGARPLVVLGLTLAPARQVAGHAGVISKRAHVVGESGTAGLIRVFDARPGMHGRDEQAVAQRRSRRTRGSGSQISGTRSRSGSTANTRASMRSVSHASGANPLTLAASAISTSQPSSSNRSCTNRAPVIDSITPRTANPSAPTRRVSPRSHPHPAATRTPQRSPHPPTTSTHQSCVDSDQIQRAP
jgi:hypothetical protein